MKRIKVFIYCGVVLLCILAAVFVYASIAPGKFPSGKAVEITKGLTLSEAAKLLKDAGVIKSELLFRLYVGLVGTSSGVRMGNYLFEVPESTLKIAYRVTRALQGIDLVKVTIPEGLATPDIAVLLKKKLPYFDDGRFRSLAKPHEGYLFPDTYFFDQFTTPEDVVAQMRDNFDKHTNGVSPAWKIRDKTFDEILIMASLVEEEAALTNDKRIIAGILWKRMKAGMALQVDAPFFYILGKASHQLTRDDLASDSPYNLYVNKGLPPTPIDNPGLDSILSSANPIETEYWFFLADDKGKIHFAETHDEHVANKAKYLN